jgi:hypothetical protein
MQKSRQVDVAPQHKLASNLSLSVTMGKDERAVTLELRHGLSGDDLIWSFGRTRVTGGATGAFSASLRDCKMRKMFLEDVGRDER